MKINKTILSLAILKANWEIGGYDYIDNFVHLLAVLIEERKYKEIKLHELRKDFSEKYGLILPHNPLVAILNRARKKYKYVKKEYGKIIPVYNSIQVKNFSASAQEIERKFNKICKELIEFANKEFGLKITNEDVELGLLSFLKTHDLDILFASKDVSILPDLKPSKKLKYVISKFIISVSNSEPEIFQFLLDVAVGHALANAVVYSTDLSQFFGKLKGLNVYLDTHIILNLMGYNGIFKKEATEELISHLKDGGASLLIFDVNKNEVLSVLEDARKRLESGEYYMDKASRVLRYCIDHELTASDVELKITSLDKLLKKYEIQESALPMYNNSEYHYQVDEVKLKNTIISVYNRFAPDIEIIGTTKEATVDRDISVLSGIYRLRQGRKPRTIGDSKYIFVTSNVALAYATRQFEQSEFEDKEYFTIPACLTDTLLDTIIWLQMPAKIHSIKKSFIGYCYSAIQPSQELISRYISEVEKLKAAGEITEDQYYLLRCHRSTLNLLELKTLGDPDNVDGGTPKQILDDIITKIKLKEKREVEDLKKKVQVERQKNEEIHNTLEIKSEKIAAYISNFLLAIMIIIAIVGSVYSYRTYFEEQIKPNPVILIITISFTLLSLVNGFNLMKLRDKVRTFIKTKIINWLQNV